MSNNSGEDDAPREHIMFGKAYSSEGIAISSAHYSKDTLNWENTVNHEFSHTFGKLKDEYHYDPKMIILEYPALKGGDGLLHSAAHIFQLSN